MAIRVSSKNGKEIVLLNPAERGKKYSIELKHNTALTNSARRKKDDKGNILHLSDKQRAFRAGYLSARNDNAKAYKSSLKKKKIELKKKMISKKK